MSGGRGISSLTICLGFALQRLAKRSALVDLDLQAAPLSVLLDVDPEHTIADLADPTSPIDSIRLESVLSKDDAGRIVVNIEPFSDECQALAHRLEAGHMIWL